MDTAAAVLPPQTVSPAMPDAVALPASLSPVGGVVPASPSRAAEELTFSRQEENRLKELRDRLEGGGVPLTPDETTEYLKLERKNKDFEDEGFLRLMEGRHGHAAGGRKEASIGETVTGALEGAARGAFFWTSWLATAGPGLVGRKIGLTDQFTHWNFITERVILGALPIITQVGTSGNHLKQIQQHCLQRGTRMGMVVSALTRAEMSGFGISFPRFAKHEDWQRDLGVQVFELLEITDMTATGADYEQMRRVVERMKAVVQLNECVYVHCKAGKGRSWMVTICYLATQENLSFDAAIALVRERRHQVSPSQAQVRFAKDFVDRYKGSRDAEMLFDAGAGTSSDSAVITTPTARSAAASDQGSLGTRAHRQQGPLQSHQPAAAQWASQPQWEPVPRASPQWEAVPSMSPGSIRPAGYPAVNTPIPTMMMEPSLDALAGSRAAENPSEWDMADAEAPMPPPTVSHP